MEPGSLEQRRAEIDAQIALKQVELANLKSRLPSAFDTYRILRMNGYHEVADKMDAFYHFEDALKQWEQSQCHPTTFTLEEILAEL